MTLAAKLGKLFARADGWVNTYTGLGDPTRDRRLSAYAGEVSPLSWTTLDRLYAQHDLAATIIDAPVDEELRKGFGIEVDDDDPSIAVEVAEAVSTRLNELGAADIVASARKWSRLYGRAAILLGADDGRPMTAPLDLERIKSLRFLTLIDGPALAVDRRYDAPLEPRHGRPEIYRITRNEPGAMSTPIALVHESRVVLFEGPPVPPRVAALFDGFSPSVFQRIHDVIRACESSWDGLEHMLQEASVGVVKMKGFLDAVGARGSDTAFANRMALLDMSRSLARSLMLDPEESYERVAMQFSGVPEALDRVMYRVSAAAKIPVTVLFGRSPAGMNATGDADLEVWRANIAAERTRLLSPKLERIVRVAMLAKDGPTRGVEPEAWSVTYPPMREMSEAETSTLRKTIAETDAIYIANEVVLPEEVAVSRFRATGYSPELRIDVEARKRMLEAEIAKAEDGAGGGDKGVDEPMTDESEAPSSPPVDESATQAPDAAPATASEAALNGAQVTALLEVIDRVARGLMPRDTAIAVISAAFGVEVSVATNLLGSVGAGFTIEPESVAQPAAAPPPPEE